jgi:hypothetical protein
MEPSGREEPLSGAKNGHIGRDDVAFTATSCADCHTEPGDFGVAVVCWLIRSPPDERDEERERPELGRAAHVHPGTWVAMMAAMMLPGAVPAALRSAAASGRVAASPLLAGSYLAVWALFGLAVYGLYRPHGASVAGGVTIAACVYELTPLKRACRRRCRDSVRSSASGCSASVRASD